jgi:hypothetical protein
MKIWSFLIIFAVTASVFTSAVFVIHMSLEQRGSHVRWAIDAPLYALALLETTLPSPHAEAINTGNVKNEVKTAEACPPNARLTEQYSLVDYLHKKHVNISFAVRAALAEEYGIPQYTGSTEQNRELLRLLKSETDVTTGTCPRQTAQH